MKRDMKDAMGVQAVEGNSVLGAKRKGHLNPSKIPSQVDTWDVRIFHLIPNTEAT